MAEIPRRHRLKRYFWIALGLILFVHTLFAFLAYHRLSLGHLIAIGFVLLFFMLTLYGLVAYVLLPRLWRRYYQHQPQLSGSPKVTHTKEGIPGDPLNVGLVGSESEVVQAMLKAQWHPADSASLETVIRIANSMIFHHPDPDAPVSNLYLGDRKQDLAFERPEGPSAKRRHHVRFWRNEGHEIEGRVFWIGAATFDQSIRMSAYTGQILHRIDPELDAERDKLLDDLNQAQELDSTFQTPGIGVTLNGRNGEGDWYYTDGQILVGVLKAIPVELPQAAPLPAPS